MIWDFVIAVDYDAWIPFATWGHNRRKDFVSKVCILRVSKTLSLPLLPLSQVFHPEC